MLTANRFGVTGCRPIIANSECSHVSWSSTYVQSARSMQRWPGEFTGVSALFLRIPFEQALFSCHLNAGFLAAFANAAYQPPTRLSKTACVLPAPPVLE